VDKTIGLDIQQLNSIKMLVLDVDGIMTDCRLWMDANGQWKRVYSVRDGVGIKALIEAGYKLAVITGATAEDVRARVKMLGIHYLFEGAVDKSPPFLELQKQSGITANEMAYMGDDYFDLPLLNAVQFSATVPDAMEEVISAVDYVTARPAGNGAVREVCNYILKYGFFSKKNS
jgi:3-deoxy-D-manno-octulosonate 8-phosphate phosphatase (KDO 8-P phosphatase)